MRKQIEFVQQRIVSKLQERGWYRHTKERTTFFGVTDGVEYPEYLKNVPEHSTLTSLGL